MDAQVLEFMRKKFRKGVEDIGFNNYLGLKLVDMQEGVCVTELTLGPQHLNVNGWLHGGVITTISDATAGYAAATMDYRVTTVNMTTEFMRRGPVSGKITCRTHVEKAGRNLMWTKAAIYDENDRLLSESTIVFFCLEKLDMEKRMKAFMSAQ